MRIDHIVCPNHIVDKLETEHHVTVQEAREVLLSYPRIRFAEKGHTPGEDVYVAFGQTFARGAVFGGVLCIQAGHGHRDYHQCAGYEQAGAQNLWTQID